MAGNYRIAVCDPQGWREFAIALDREAAADLEASATPIAFLRQHLADERFVGHVMVWEPVKRVGG